MGEVDHEALAASWAQCNNWGRWGEDDELGTLNFITPEKRVAAASLVETGQSISLTRLLDTEPSHVNVHPMDYYMVTSGQPFALNDYVGIQSHGFVFTHLDALAHVSFEGLIYNGRRRSEVATLKGVTFGSILAQQAGIFTRGVLLDIAAVRGVDWLEPHDGVTVEDLERAEEREGVHVGSGDALFVRVGLAVHEASLGRPLAIPPRSGLMPETLPWLHEREVAVFGGDCVERVPYGSDEMPMPLHQIGIAGMGLTLLDWPEVEGLAEACREHERYEFLLTVAGLPIPGGTGSVVNPIATF